MHGSLAVCFVQCGVRTWIGIAAAIARPSSVCFPGELRSPADKHQRVGAKDVVGVQEGDQRKLRRGRRLEVEPGCAASPVRARGVDLRSQVAQAVALGE